MRSLGSASSAELSSHLISPRTNSANGLPLAASSQLGRCSACSKAVSVAALCDPSLFAAPSTVGGVRITRIHMSWKGEVREYLAQTLPETRGSFLVNGWVPCEGSWVPQARPQLFLLGCVP